jgi:SecD/SecF fusion protein
MSTNTLLFLLAIFSLVLFVWYFATEKENRKMWVGTLLSAILIAASVYFLKTQRFQLGIDLQGGVAYTVSVVPQNGEAVSVANVNAAKEILERRLSPLGNKDVVITPLVTGGSAKLYIEVPGITPEESEKNRQTIEKTAKLDFRLLHPSGDSLIQARSETSKVIEPGWVEIPNLQLVDPRVDPKDPEAVRKAAEKKVQEALENRGVSPEEQAKRRMERIYRERLTVITQKNPILGGKSVQQAAAVPDPNSGYWMIAVKLDGDYGDKMREVSSQNVGKPLGIVVDDELISSPTINEPLGANFQITGQFTQAEAESLASMLENPLENPLRIDQVSNTSSTYGEALIKQGFWSGAIGLALTLIFMAIYYRLAGIIAIIGLTVNLLLLMAAMNVFEFSLTMPGIAGIILTLGIAIDANVLIYERMREEFASGKSLDGALSASYSKAFTAIFDSNLTSLITSIIMIIVATGSIRGFGVTLTIGVLASLLTALLVTRVLFRWLLKLGLTKISFMSLVKNRYIDFMGKRKQAFIFSAVLVLASIGIIVMKGEKALGYELRGGDIVSVTGITAGEVSAAIAEVKNAEGGKINAAVQTIQPFGDAGASVNIRANFGEGKIIKDTLLKLNDQVKIGDVQSVGPAVGNEMLEKAIWAIVLGLVGIFIYLVVRYETPFAIGGIIAIFHDVIVAAGVCVLCGKELGMIMIGAFLTIAGYSINDTIVIFDRVREQLKTSNGTLAQVLNEAVSATLSRTIITAGVTLLVVISMLLYGGATLADFSLAMLVGIIIGSYSTIFIATATVLWWAQTRKLNLAAHIQEAEQLRATIGSGMEREVNPNEALAEEAAPPKP